MRDKFSGNLRAGLLLFFMPISFFASAQTIWTAGPMLHVNFGGGKTTVSYSVEVAYWNFSGFPYSIDFAAEFESKRIRLYSETQTGVGVAGVAAGPVLEFQTDKGATKLGLQASLWGNYFFGFDLRYRAIDSHSSFCPGIYVKTGFAGRDKDGNAIRSSSHWHDLDD
jgi:hypothetical protein